MHKPLRQQLVDSALSVISQARVPVEAVARRDRDLGSQLRRALSSVALHLADGARVGWGQCAGALRERARLPLRSAGGAARCSGLGLHGSRGVRAHCCCHGTACRSLVRADLPEAFEHMRPGLVASPTLPPPSVTPRGARALLQQMELCSSGNRRVRANRHLVPRGTGSAQRGVLGFSAKPTAPWASAFIRRFVVGTSQR